MCGIAAYVPNRRGRSSARVTLNTLSTLFARIETRGEHSAGIAAVDDTHGEVHVLKSPVPGHMLMLDEATRDWVREHVEHADAWLLHARFATHGAITAENAHPLTVGPVTLVHNGMLWNYERLWKELPYEPQTPVDSEVLAALLASADPADVSSYVNTLEKASGSAAAIAYDTRAQGVLHVFVDGNPLEYASTRYGLVLASEAVERRHVVARGKSVLAKARWRNVDQCTYARVVLATRRVEDVRACVLTPYGGRSGAFDWDDVWDAVDRLSSGQTRRVMKAGTWVARSLDGVAAELEDYGTACEWANTSFSHERRPLLARALLVFDEDEEARDDADAWYELVTGGKDE